MLLRSSVLLLVCIVIPLLVVGSVGVGFLSDSTHPDRCSNYPVIAVFRFGSTVVLGLPLITFSLVHSSWADQTRLVRQKWCDWTSWSRCSPEPCHAGVRRTWQLHTAADSSEERRVDGTATPQTEVDKEDENEIGQELATNYCVVKPGPWNSREVHPLLVQVTVGGVVKRREPAKQRTRTCSCQSISLLRLFGFHKRDECSPNTIQVECGQCSQDEKVYQTRRYEFDESVLPFCDQSTVVSTQLYKILGGIAGGVIVVLFIVWVVRMLVRTVCHRSASSSSPSANSSDRGFGRRDRGRHDGRRGREGRSSRQRNAATGENDMTDPLQIPGAVSVDNELPPSYKDVVLNIPGVVFVDPDTTYMEMDPARGEPNTTDRFVNRFRRPRSSSGRGQRAPQPPPPQQIASSSGTSIEQEQRTASRTPPPPSYEDVMSSPNMELVTQPGDTFRLVELTNRASVSDDNVDVSNVAGSRTELIRNRMVHLVETPGSGVMTGPSQVHVPQPSSEMHNPNLPPSIVEATTTT